MAKFTPKSDTDLNNERLLPAGEYDFQIHKAEDKTFRSGSAGISLTVAIYQADGTYRLVNDNLVFIDSAMFKVSNFAKATGLYEQYKQGEINAIDCEGKTGRVKLKIEPEGEYPAKNSVANYVVPKEAKAKPAATSDVPEDPSWMQ